MEMHSPTLTPRRFRQAHVKISVISKKWIHRQTHTERDPFHMTAVIFQHCQPESVVKNCLHKNLFMQKAWSVKVQYCRHIPVAREQLIISAHLGEFSMREEAEALEEERVPAIEWNVFDNQTSSYTIEKLTVGTGDTGALSSELFEDGDRVYEINTIWLPGTNPDSPEVWYLIMD